MLKGLLCGAFCCITVLLTIFMLMALRSLEYNEIGLNYSSWFKSIEADKTYTPGWYMVGLGHSFLKYSVTAKDIEFTHFSGATMPPIKCRTSDGLTVSLEVSLQYRPQKDHIYKIYHKFGEKPETVLERLVIDSVASSAAKFSAV